MKRSCDPEDRDSSKAAYSRALRWLMARELSEGQIRERLAVSGYSASAIEPAVQRLLSEHSIDDRRTASAMARTEARVRRHGPRRVLGKLMAIKIDRELAKEVVTDVFGEFDQDALLQATLDRRLRGQPQRLKDSRERRKIHAYLVRQGFAASAASAALRKKSVK